MALVVTIEQISVENFDGGTDQIKKVSASINGTVTKHEWAYPTITSDATIEAEVAADLTAKGYVI